MATNTEARKARERRLRAKYRKKTIVTAIITLLIGVIIGFVLCAVLVSKPGPISRMLKVGPLDDNMVPIAADEDADFGADEDFGSDEGAAFGSDEDFDSEGDFADEAEESALDEGEESTPEPSATPSPTPTPEPTPSPTPAPQIVPFGQPMVIQTEVKSDGSIRTTADDEPFETLNFTLKIDAYKNLAYFQETYGTQYMIKGDEAAVQFDITLNGYNGALQVIPQDVLKISLMGDTPEKTEEGYQLLDAEMGGKTGIVVAPNTATTLYKRYSYSAAVGDMKYLVVTTYNNGEPTTYWFDIEAPEPVATTATEGEGGSEGADASTDAAASVNGLTVGSEGEEVSRLQRALIAKGLLQGAPDGKFGNYTADAVKAMQSRYGMAQTGVADQAFLDRLYADQ